ncbi:MAG: UDP-N-acetylmuramoyl-L-alanyl-D-glutamate--2,6-diaminopimelate ligase [Schaalia hyovaginalis]|uniref:UDP-N-acetylmuramoyl-L-alanyl-D-glutamate--2, 6-diaminopimelate ligase n=1 Tax=Schaalia hyovaginalis TaxID=29316 RepID=UPI002A81AB75|nr:UDP-N-acetylmuramoyl-L-alanyl-D-glutamate--2,6-diaminopimelate ligase [Schaalia hyovaginalis]MDY3665097.1 UDP-N-acetylmuramoyl-L-alanyl-D-glutamate--2,6-diaminopimelate ligase [Schaalia hyovaginalis]MDY4262360.1 UDP-N-acetylmuramoyl-L-alanyl-D-glutamate--2,6-diaminopimelate ligase [Schaalia hyovaginalis]
MTSVVDIRPAVAPLPLPRALEGVSVEALFDSSGAPIALEDASAIEVRGVTVSSNDCDRDWIFVAIPGLTQHGVRFAQAARTAGASVLVTDAEGARLAQTMNLGLPVVVCSDPRSATATIARTVYGAPASRLTTMAVTGTNGKTTTSFLMRAALGVRHSDASLCGTVETRIGDLRFRSDQTTAESPVVERFLASTLEKGLGAAVVETSSHALSLGRVDGVVFDVVGFTNLQHDHLDYYGDMESYFAAKKMLFTPEHSLRGVVCVDDEWGRRLASEAGVPVVTVAALSAEEADWRVEDAHPDRSIGRTVFTLVDPDGDGHRVAMPILGEVNVQNTAVAIVAAVQLGYPVDDVIRAVEGAEQIPGRMEKVNPEPGAQPLVIVDYAHTPEALEWTLRSTRELTAGRLHIVFGTDGDRDASKREILAAIAAREADVLWVTDENPRTEDPQGIRDYLLRGIAAVRPALEDVTEIRTCRRDAVRRAILAADAGDTVIITGKGAEWYQDIEGIKHEYNDVPVAREVLAYDVRAHL